MSTYPDFEKFNLMKQEQTIASDSTSPQLLSKEEQEADRELRIGVRFFLKEHPHAGASFAFCEGVKWQIARSSRVEGERDELRKERDEWKEKHAIQFNRWYEMVDIEKRTSAERDSLRVENQRLRELLGMCIEPLEWVMRDCSKKQNYVKAASYATGIKEIRAALSQSTTP